MEPDDPVIAHTLLARAAAASRRSEELVREALVLTETSAALRGEMAARCAWCGRYRLGEQWIGEEDLPGFSERFPEASHTICPDCVERLRETGQSI